uniref:Centromere protein J C-terminal domain-containing protein n=1 Tax=Biomphalaria glabrata TaxID=6526 RepID=A0A2C9JNJ7_BIOGL
MNESGIDLNLPSNSYDLLEAHQAIEQKRLLQRFKELRQWQQQQQEQLMLQQQQQLKAWQEEQNKVQTLIATQRGTSWSQVLRPNMGSHTSPVLTPPVKQQRITESTVTMMDSTDASLMQTAGVSEDSGMASMQDTLKSQGTLPKPVMYIDPSKIYNINDEDRYTSSELFSNPGSTEDQLDILKEDHNPQIPDWMSDTSENFVPLILPPPRPMDNLRNDTLGSQLASLDHLLSTVPAGILQQMLKFLPGKTRTESSILSTNEVELSASPTLPGPGQQSWARKLHFIQPEPPPNPAAPQILGSGPLPKDQTHSSQLSQKDAPKALKLSEAAAIHKSEVDVAFIPRAFTFNDDDDDDGDEDDDCDPRRFSRITEENEEDLWNEEHDEVDYSDNEYGEHNVTAQEVSKIKPDDRPIKGAGDTKSFEQLLEEKLKQEEGKDGDENITNLEITDRKKSFLKRGEGISRFKRPPKKVSKVKSGSKSAVASASLKLTEASKLKQNTLKPTVPPSEGEESIKKTSVGSRLKSFSKSTSSLPAVERKVVSLASKNAQQDGRLKSGNIQQNKNGYLPQDCPPNLDLIRNAASRKVEEQKLRNREAVSTLHNPGMDHINQIRQTLLSNAGRSPSLESRSTHGDGDTTELDSLAEFELLEDAVDNISFCSNSSLIKKLLNNDKQGQKEAINRIKSKTEQKKSLERHEGNDSDEDTLREITDEDVDPTETENKNNSCQKGQGSLSSVSKMSLDQLDLPDINRDFNTVLNSSDLHSLGVIVESQSTALPQSPSKVMTRKIAPMTSRYNNATDTLSMLKALSLQAGILTSTAVTDSGNGLRSSLSSSQPNLSTGFLLDKASPDFRLIPPSSLESQSEQTLLKQVKPTFQPINFPPNQFLSTSNKELSNANPESKSSQIGSVDLGDKTKAAGQKAYDSLRYGMIDTDDDDLSDYNHYEESEESEEESNLSGGDNDAQHLGKALEQQSGPAVKRFDDESSWVEDSCDDEQTCIKPLTTSTLTRSVPVPSTPPTSKLVSRLFPKLKPKPSAQEEKNQEVLQLASTQPVQSDGVQSRILREKLKELEVEIERFRSENANLDKLRREREEGLAKLKQEIDTFQKEKEMELKRLEDFKAEEMKKIKRERKLFDNYQSKIRSMPDKRDREEIEMLRNQLQELQDELKRKESRWNSSTARLKNRIAELELENGEVKEEIRILEKKRLEWMTSQSNAKVSQAQTNGKSGTGDFGKSVSPSPRSSTPTRETGRNKETSGQVAQTSSSKSSSTSSTAVPSLAGSKKKLLVNSSSQSSSNSPAPSSEPKIQSAQQVNMAADTMQTQKTSVPVMMDNTLPSCTQSSSMPGAQNYSGPSSGARSAAMIAMEKAVVDKGDVTAFKESRHPEGKVEKTYKTGAKEIHFPNGTVKEISADGQTIICRLANGDIRQIFPDHRVVYIFAEAEILQTTYSDGLETFEFKNGQTEKRYPDGTVEIIFPSKDVKYLFPDGGQEVILTNGTVMQYNTKGERTVEYPSGDREIHTAEFQRREFPDGIIKTVYADGRHETRFPNGRVRLRDKSGTVIMDQIVYR